ncbi:MAG: M20/M25/M40 family metallo-hydrolase [Oscillospiraceae bacterium]|nr:M20/M25/M40 family metallo-hydrolase [Oscillospiraceae bacterium]
MKKHKLLPESARKNVSPDQNAAYAATLKRMLDCKTVWTPSGENRGEFLRFYDIVAESFPLLHSRARRLSFGEGCFFYVIEGKNASRNILLMSHHDVVDGGEGWDSDPFCAVEKDGCLFARGAVDTKTPLFAELQAAEELLREGSSFDGINLYIGSAPDEEVSGEGMLLAAEHFRREGIRFHVILDEGGGITSGMIPGVSAKSAVIAVHEKGRHHYRCTLSEKHSGHGGLNPKSGSAVATMSEFINRVEKSGIFKASFAPEVRATFERHAPYMSFPLKLVFGNFPLFSPLIKKIMMKIPVAAAMLSTGCTFTTFHAGDPSAPRTKANSAEVNMFLRCVREDTLRQEMEKVREIASEYGIEIEEVMRDYCEPSSFESEQYRTLESLLHENFPDVIVAPMLLTAGTDARRFGGLADSILRFAPLDLSKQQYASVHAANENIGIGNIGQCVLFYKDFIKRI